MLTDIIVDIQQRESGTTLAPDVVSELRDLAVEFNVESNPRWLLPVFSAVQEGRSVTPPVFIERDGSDTHSYLAEVASLLRWEYESEGEYNRIKFTRLGWQIYVSHESHSPVTGLGGSEYQVTCLAPHEGT